MIYALVYDTVENFAERRKPYRPEHLALIAEAHAGGRLLMAGAMKPVDGAIDGALLVFRCDHAADVEAFARRDPYVANSIVTRWRVREWDVVIGQ